MEHDLTPGFQNYKTGSGQISKIATITENSKKITKSTFTELLNILAEFCMEYQWNIGIQKIYKKKYVA